MHKLRNDLILIGVLVMIAVISLVLFFTLSEKDNLTVLIYENNELIYQGDMKEEKEITCHQVTIQIQKDGVYVSQSNCKDQICVHQGKISRSGQTIICLPNQVVVRLEGRKVDVGI